jgi:GLPGLI family protein
MFISSVFFSDYSMKKATFWFSLICICTFSSSIAAGQNIFGRAVYKYKFNFSSSTSDTLTGELYFNDLGESYYYSSNNAIVKQENSIHQSEQKQPSKYKIKDSVIVYRNALTREHFFKKNAFFKTYLVADTLNDIAWELVSDDKKVGNFQCKSAKTRLAGRNYQVWYSADLPISSGPWKFFGLPGLIIEIKDDRGLIYFTLDNININPSMKKDFQVAKLRKMAISKQEFKKQSENDVEKLKGQANSMGVRVTVKTTSTGIEIEENE